VKHSVDAAEIGLLVLQAPRHEMRRRPLARLVLGLFGFAALLLFVLVFGLLFKPAGSAQRRWPEQGVDAADLGIRDGDPASTLIPTRLGSAAANVSLYWFVRTGAAAARSCLSREFRS
jgi:hypothetical protein